MSDTKVQMGMTPAARDRLIGRDRYSIAEVFSHAVLERTLVRWSDWVMFLRTKTTCPPGNIKTAVDFVDSHAPFLAACGLIDPSAIEEVIKGCTI